MKRTFLFSSPAVNSSLNPDERSQPSRRSWFACVASFTTRITIFFSVFLIAGCPLSTVETLTFSQGFTPPGISNDGDEGIVLDSVIAYSGERIFVGGKFTSVNGVSARNIAVYDIATDTWASLANGGLQSEDPQGFPAEVRSLIPDGQYLYVGGYFNQTSDGAVLDLNCIARYDLINHQWSALSNQGLNGNVNAFAVDGDHLYVGGEFSLTRDGTVAINRIGRYNTVTHSWTNISDGTFNDRVNALCLKNNALYVGGNFHSGATGRNRIARYDLSTNGWSALANEGLNGNVNAIVSSSGQNELFVGGAFFASTTPVMDLRGVARYDLDNNLWSPLNLPPLTQPVYALVHDRNHHNLYIGGAFGFTIPSSGITVQKIVNYDTISETFAPFEQGGLNEVVYSLLLDTLADIRHLYIGGAFTQTYEGPSIFNGFAKYSTQETFMSNPEVESWSTVGESSGIALDGPVGAIATGSGANVFVGGEFANAGGGQTVDLNNIAVYDNSTHTWAAVGNKGVNGGVNALLLNGNDLYVGGSFTRTFDNAVQFLNGIAKYNVVTRVWTPLSDFGLNGEVRALALIGDGLYVGGDFSGTVGGGTTGLNKIARYNIATGTWAPLANGGLADSVTGLAASGTNLYASGIFTRTHDTTIVLNRIGRFDITSNTWSPLNNNGLNGNVINMGIDQGVLFMRGTFSSTFDNSTPLDRLAQYDLGAGQWAPATGTTNAREAAVRTAAVARLGHDTYVGGEFYVTDPGVAHYFTVIYGQQWIPSAMLNKLQIISTDWFDPANWNTGEAPAPNSNAVIPAGAGNIDILTGDVVMNDLILNGGTINIGAGRTLTINGSLSLSGGMIQGDGDVIINTCGLIGINSGNAASHIRTSLTRCVQADKPYNFPVGTANGYSPVFFDNITGTGNITVKSNEGQYSGAATGLPAERLARWWHIENPGGGVTEADLLFSYQQSDITGFENAYRAFRISGGVATQIPGTINLVSNRVEAPDVTAFSDWTLAKVPGSISGTITYGNPGGAPTPRVVSNVTLTAVGSTNIFTTTDFPGGNYTLTGFGSGSYTVTPTKLGGVNGAISSFDAGRIALHVAGVSTPQLNATQLIVADVSGNSSVTSFDAAMIAKFVAGPPYTPPGIGSTANWRFAPVSRNYASVTSDISAEDYSALLMGEVSGNWTNTEARPAGGEWSSVSSEQEAESVSDRRMAMLKGPEKNIIVNIPNIVASADKDILIPVTVAGVADKSVISYEFDLMYDPSVIQPFVYPAELAGTVSRGLSVVTNATQPGILRVVVYGAMAISDDGVLLNLRFSAIGSAGSGSPLSFERIMFNEGATRTLVTNGKLELL